MTRIQGPRSLPFFTARNAPQRQSSLVAGRRPAHLWVAEIVIAVGLAGCVLVVHDVPYLLRTPYWLDEAWVVVSTRTSLGRLPEITSATPIGWTFLIRLVPGSSEQVQRLLPLFFAGLTVLAAYGLARTLRLLPVLTGLLAGGAALLVPAMLARDDLKEYTADAFGTLLIFALVSWLESSWSRRRLTVVCLTVVALAFISHVALLVAAAAFTCLAVVRLLQRRWHEFAEVVVASAATGLVLVAIFLVFDGGVRTKSLQEFWSAYYIPHSPSGAIRYIHTALHHLLPYFGIGHATLLAALVLSGVVVLAWQRRWATAAMLPVLSIELVVLSALHRYPLLDERTSTFLITCAVVVAAIGVAGASTLVAQRVHITAGILLAAVAAGLYIPSTLKFVNGHPIPPEDVRAQAAYVTAHEAPNDVVLVSLGASYGYAYYAPPDPHLVKSGTGIGFSVTYPAKDRIVALAGRDPADIRAGLARALALVNGHPGARLWIVLSHVASSEMKVWTTALAPLPVTAVRVAPDAVLSYVVLSHGPSEASR